jgi:tetratricopeptide (TPR) repeat protein
MIGRYSFLAFSLFGAACATSDPEVGEGRITLSPRVKANFEEYKTRDAPIYFVVTESGFGSYYIYCDGGFNCTRSAARTQALDRCRRLNPDEDCKVYAVGRNVVWRNADAPRPPPQLSASELLIRACVDGDTPQMRVDKCSQAIASPELAESQKRGAFYVRARAYEQLGDLPEAESDYRAVLTIDPDNAAAKTRLENLPAPAAPPKPTPPSSA